MDGAMSHNTSVSLGDHFKELSAQYVEEGRYGSVSEVVRAGLRLLEKHEHRVKALRQAIKDGVESGFPEEPFDADAFLLRVQEKHGRAA